MAEPAWTAKQLEALAKLWAEGHPCSVIGARIGKSKNAVIGKRVRMRLPDRSHGSQHTRPNGRPKLETQKPFTPSGKRILHPVHKRREIEVKMKVAPQEYKPALEPECAGAPAPLMLDLLDLPETGCKWPVTAKLPHLFCGHERMDGSPYCADHSAVAFNRPIRKPQNFRLVDRRAAA